MQSSPRLALARILTIPALGRVQATDPGDSRQERGELSDAQLDDAARQISTGEPLSELGTEALALSPGSSIMGARGRPA